MAKKQTTAKAGATAKKKAAAKKPSAGTKKKAAPATAAKPAAAGKPAAAPATVRTLPAETPKRRETLDAIVAIARELDDAGLDLLLEQAKVVKTKGQIEQFNRELNVSAHRAAAARKQASRPDYRVAIERTKDNFFIIQLDTARIFFNLEEMRTIVRICQTAADARLGARKLYRWFSEERSDLLVDASIRSETNPYLGELYDLVISTYTVKK